MIKFEYFIAFLVAILAVLGAAGVVFAHFEDKSLLSGVQNGKYELICGFKDGERVVPGDRVKDRFSGVWVFDNGQASNCMVKK